MGVTGPVPGDTLLGYVLEKKNVKRKKNYLLSLILLTCLPFVSVMAIAGLTYKDFWLWVFSSAFFSYVRLINCLRSLRVLLSQPTLAGL